MSQMWLQRVFSNENQHQLLPVVMHHGDVHDDVSILFDTIVLRAVVEIHTQVFKMQVRAWEELTI